MDIIVGTAGHIDHGKTALVKALTGTDADRFPEEKLRGITIDIGFAELELGDLRIGFVDVPGHERFVKNMLAGAHGIDLVALVVAADEGVMPQTREHFEICRLLEIKAGLIVLTKKDLADTELLEIAELDVAELVQGSFLENVPVHSVSARTGEGIEELKAILQTEALKIPTRRQTTVMRLPIDRSFSVKGFGAVVTGTLLAGEIREGDELEIQPTGQRVRVRGLQTYGQTVETARAGQRTAVNLGGIEHIDIERGMILTEPEVLRPTQMLDVQAEVLNEAKKGLRSRQRVRVHIGTVEALGRLQILETKGEISPGKKGLMQIRLETPVVAIPGERFILRAYSPQVTIAGGLILDAAAKKHRRKDFESAGKFLKNLIESAGDNTRMIKLVIENEGERGAAFSDLRARTGWLTGVLQKAIAENLANTAIIDAGSFYVARTPFDGLKARTLNAIGDFHDHQPLARGILRETLREQIFAHLPPDIFKTVLRFLEQDKSVAAENDIVRAFGHSLELSADEKLLRTRLEEIYRSAGLEVPKLDDALAEAVNGTGLNSGHARKIFQLLLNTGEIVRISGDFYFAGSAIEKLIDEIRSFAAKNPDRLIDMPSFKDLAGVSRKYAIPLLEYFDSEKVTRRAGDKRLIL